jgi:adenylate cyclase
MPVEIERKFLVCNDSWRGKYHKMSGIRQGYLCAAENCTVRVRLDGGNGWLTVKGRTSNISRPEFEYPIPCEEAGKMLSDLSSGAVIEKTRYFVNYKGNEWVIDEFAGDNKGLILAEVELESEQQEFEKPEWAGKEVSDDHRYCNSSLSRNPYRNW